MVLDTAYGVLSDSVLRLAEECPRLVPTLPLSAFVVEFKAGYGAVVGKADETPVSVPVELKLIVGYDTEVELCGAGPSDEMSLDELEISGTLLVDNPVGLGAEVTFVNVYLAELPGACWLVRPV